MKNRKNKKGFTLVELVVVIAIIAILGAVSVVGYLGFIDKANKSAAETEATQIRTVLIAGAADPDTGFTLAEGGKALTIKTASDENGNDAAVLKTYFATMTETAEETINLVECTANGNVIDVTTEPSKDESVQYLLYTNAKASAVIDFVNGTVKAL